MSLPLPAATARPRRHRRCLALVAAALGLAACGGESRAPEETLPVPSRRATGGDRMLALAPGGAEAVLEIDLARLRGNPAVGPLVRAVTASELTRPDVFAAADLLVLCSYRIGESDAGQLALARGARVERLPGARVLDTNLVAIGPPALLDRVDLVRAGAEPSLASDRALLRVRALAMPERAQGASVRLAARLGFEARLSLARRLELDVVPAWLSVWADVADDMAAVALLGGEGPGEAQELARAVTRVRDRLARSEPSRRLGVGRTVAATEVDVRGSDVRVVLLVGPRRLARLVDRVMARLTAPREPEQADDAGDGGQGGEGQ
jgi:hypothetical protein